MIVSRLPEKEPGCKSRTLAGASCGLSRQGWFLSRLSRDALRLTLAGVSYMLSQLFSLLESSITCTVCHHPCGGRRVRGASRAGWQLQKQPWAVTSQANSLARLTKTCHGSIEIAVTKDRYNRDNRRPPVSRQNRRNPAIGGALRSPDRREEEAR
jgi:hypothetical protein